MKKIALVFILVFVFTGCGNKEVEKIKVNDDEQLEEMKNLIEQQKNEIENLNQKFQEMENNNAEEKTGKESVNIEKDNEITEEEAKKIASNVTYCQANANSYSLDNYNRLKKGPKQMKEKCEEKNELKEDLCKSTGNECDDEDDCDKVYKNNMKEVEEYKIKYDEYHQKCD
ncbi:MAG: hypothetical protein KAT32_01950 [Candidatus Moranbacteria bacterium]|nr:hypothetical protein [Candidatus Moranbacteria bacterium]